MQQCNQLSVTLDVDGKQGFVLVGIPEINFVEYDGIDNRIIVHTKQGKFYMMGTLKYLIEGLNASGYYFKLVDRNNAVNVDNIVYLEKSSKKAYFEWPTNSKSKSCTFSGKHFDEIVREFSGAGAIGRSIVLA